MSVDEHFFFEMVVVTLAACKLQQLESFASLSAQFGVVTIFSLIAVQNLRLIINGLCLANSFAL